MTSHIPTAIQLLYASDDVVGYLQENRMNSRPYLNILSNIFIPDDFLDDRLTFTYSPIEKLYINSVHWDVVYQPTAEEHLQLYMHFFKEQITERSPVSDDDLIEDLEKEYHTPYVKWCCAICQILWKFVAQETSHHELSRISNRIIRYIRNSIYRDMRQVIDVMLLETEANPKNLLRIKLRERELR